CCLLSRLIGRRNNVIKKVMNTCLNFEEG
ncbi:hypothetical protein A2U01_0097002, partial [Trifolium medium]|nr:hypothetical protein [Trifolium medium]